MSFTKLDKDKKKSSEISKRTLKQERQPKVKFTSPNKKSPSEARKITFEELKGMLPAFLIGNGLVLLICGLIGVSGLLPGKIDWRVLTGLLAGNVFAISNFLLIGATVGNVVERKDPKHARTFSTFSYFGRYSLMFALYALLITFNLVNAITALIPLFFTKVHYSLKAIFNKEI